MTSQWQHEGEYFQPMAAYDQPTDSMCVNMTSKWQHVGEYDHPIAASGCM